MGLADKLPTKTLVPLTMYRLKRQLPGEFLTACLKNDFVGAVCLADAENLKAIVDIAKYIYNEMPARCWGSPAKVQAWIEGRDQ